MLTGLGRISVGIPPSTSLTCPLPDLSPRLNQALGARARRGASEPPTHLQGLHRAALPGEVCASLLRLGETQTKRPLMGAASLQSALPASAQRSAVFFLKTSQPSHCKQRLICKEEELGEDWSACRNAFNEPLVIPCPLLPPESPAVRKQSCFRTCIRNDSEQPQGIHQLSGCQRNMENM